MISVCIITKNEEANIARCVRSVQWADEIIVVDAESTDRTGVIARENGARVIERRWEGFAKQKEFAVLQASSEWVLSLDADEEVSDELEKEIREVLSAGTSYDGFEIARKSYFLGQWMRHGGWYPGYQLRLFRKSKTRMNHRPVHEGFMVDGRVGRLSSDINHYTYTSLHQYIDKMNDYSSLDVMNKISSQKIIRWYNFILNPLSAFLRMYISLQGFRDGLYGFFLAWYSALHVLVIYAKCWEYQIAQKNGTPLPPVTGEDLTELKRLA
ncbi:MAG: glycosyltransferase family 2 protein [Bacteroidota bacterium]